MGYKKKTDKNQETLVNILRQLGYCVESLHRVGRGIPDLLISDDENHLAEVKTEEGDLNDKQKKFHLKWRGKIYIFRNIEDVMKFHSERVHRREMK